MNRTVEDVGALILAIILMVVLYGIYKLGVKGLGDFVFSSLQNLFSNATNSVSV